MASTKYSDLFPSVLTELPGVSTLQAEEKIRAAVIDLCRKAKIWTHEDDPTATMAQARSYDINTPSGSALVEIRALHLNGKPLGATTEDDSNYRTEYGTPEFYFQVSPEFVALWPVPDAEYLFTMDLTLAPSRTSTTFPSWIAERYHDAIVAGAKSRLMGMPGQPWSNIQLAVHYAGLFNNEVAEAKSDTARSFVRAPMRTTPHY